jgi:hypothetical protein
VLQHNLTLGDAHFGLCATGLHCPIAISDWAMQGQCTEVFESDPHSSSQCQESLDNEGRSNQLRQPPRIATQINPKGGIDALECMAGN